MSKNRKKLKIDTLRYPLWFNIIFYSLTIIAPLILIVLEGLKTPNTLLGTTFKISFMVMVVLTITWFFMKKLIINKIETKLLAHQVALEHDYSIDIGDKAKVKQLWINNQRKLTIYEFLQVMIYGGLLFVIGLGISSQVLKIKNLIVIIMSLYLIAYTIKFVVLLLRGEDDE